MIVKFKNIGKDSKCFQKECKTKLTEDWFRKHVKPHILSSVIEFHSIEDGKVGVFVGGIRQVGEIEIGEV